MPDAINDPLNEDSPPEVNLPDAPLVRVVSQIRFTEILLISQTEFIAPFQEAIRRDYPKVKREDATIVTVGPDSSSNVQRKIVTWRFFDAETKWRLSLATDFLSLETTDYSSRDDFLTRFEKVTNALAECLEPSFATRLGVRYVDRISGDQFANIQSLVRDEMVGVLTSSLQSGLIRSMSEFNFKSREGNLLARWGVMAENSTHDPDILLPSPERTWILDLDSYQMYSRDTQPFEPAALMSNCRSLANRAYTFFRWAVRDEFLEAYGGKL